MQCSAPQLRRGALRIRAPSSCTAMGPGFAEQRDRTMRSLSSGAHSRDPLASPGERCTASRTREEIALRGRVVICPSGGFLTGLSSLISDFPKNISVPTHPKSDLELFASHPTRGAYRDRHGRGVRMRWTRQRQARNVMQGGFPCGACERSNGGLTNDVAAYGKIVWS